MLGKLGWWRHAVVGTTVAGCGALAALGVIGSGPERFDAKQVIVQPAGGDGIQITEIVDIDFGNDHRHGYERLVPNDFGVPTNISATSSDAPDDVAQESVEGDKTRIRVGRSDTTVSGQHRYVLRYTLPNARVTTGQLALDIIGTDETLETDRFEVVVTGFQLDTPLCNVGSSGASGGCTLSLVGDVYRAVIAPLKPHRGITIGGTIVAVTEPVDLVVPPLPTRRDQATLPLTLGIMALGATGGGAVYALARRRGRNQVFGGGGAADAAYGALPRPGLPVPAAASTRLVADDRLDELATIEFVPPPGLVPWQGAAILNERLDDGVVAAWFSGLAAADVITLDQRDDKLVVGPGPKLAQTDAATAKIIATMLNGRDELTLGTYDKHFASAWRSVRTTQQAMIAQSGWWTRLPRSGSGGGAGVVVLVIIGFFVFGIGSMVSALLGAARSVPVALLFGLIVPSVAAWSVYGVLLPSRSATGSAMALRTESFRRFLAASEGRHVEWAWKQGLLREYSAWAVSLGAAKAWGKALEASNVPEPEIRLNTTPLLLYSMSSSLAGSRTAPSSSGSGGSSFGGFSGGSVGGGGGGGSSGSW